MGWERLPVDLHTADAKSPYGTVDIETRGPYWDKPIRLTSRPDSPSSATTTSMVGSASFSWVNNFSISYLEKSDWQIHISRGDWATLSKKHTPISPSCFSDSLSDADSLRGVRRSEIRYRDHEPRVLPFADVKATGLSRVYETRKRKYGIGSQTISRINAVVDLELEIEQGELFGLLGPNGAGKTTTVKMLCTLLTPTRGNASIRGLDIVKDANKVRKIVNMVAGGE